VQLKPVEIVRAKRHEPLPSEVRHQPEAFPVHPSEPQDHVLRQMGRVREDCPVRFALELHEIGSCPNDAHDLDPIGQRQDAKDQRRQTLFRRGRGRGRRVRTSCPLRRPGEKRSCLPLAGRKANVKQAKAMALKKPVDARDRPDLLELAPLAPKADLHPCFARRPKPRHGSLLAECAIPHGLPIGQLHVPGFLFDLGDAAHQVR